MTRIWKAALCLLAVSVFSVQAQTWEEGQHYRKLDTPVATSSSDKIEVAEVFWYGCPHCFSFKPVVEAWEEDMADDIKFELIPAALGRGWEPHARAFYTNQALGKLEETHDAMFNALARDRKPLNDVDALADLAAQKGVDRDAFVKTFDSFGVNAKMQQSDAKVRGARITGVPSMLVNGKYVVSASGAGSHEDMMKVVDYLVEKERTE